MLSETGGVGRAPLYYIGIALALISTFLLLKQKQKGNQYEIKNNVFKIFTAMAVAVLMIMSAIPFASAATNNNLLDTAKKYQLLQNVQSRDIPLLCIKLLN